MVLSDDSDVTKNLGVDRIMFFLEPQKNMKCNVSESIMAKCGEFVNNFNNPNNSQVIKNIFHDKKWKESESKLVEISERILSVL